ncbi:MAG: hypothetical protein ACAI35_10560 [Candidatus Methylacidiphilales bacterium]|nr:hypothetical protein [Candidatus Methylacidiphilales bacterium]
MKTNKLTSTSGFKWSGVGGRRAFSLVEVAIAIGVVVFCIFALVALLPVGLDTMKSTREESGAAVCLEQISTAFRHARVNGTSQYQARSPYSGLSWTSPNTMTNISLGGLPSAHPMDQRLCAYVEVKAMPSATSPGVVFVSVAWPNRAQWNSAETNWTNASGSVSTWLYFIPRK